DVTREQRSIQSLWMDLAERNAQRSRQALYTLVRSRELTLRLLEKHLRPIPTRSQPQIAALVSELNAARFSVRNEAEQELRGLGEQIVPVLRKVTQTSRSSVEATKRIDRLLREFNGRESTPTETLGRLRALSLAAYFIDSPEARTVLERVARGDSS